MLVSVTLDFYLPDNRREELQEKYNQEVEKRKSLETELKILQVKVSTFSVTYCSPFAFVSVWLLKLTNSTYAIRFSSLISPRPTSATRT